MASSVKALLEAVGHERALHGAAAAGEVITVSDTVSAAASVYESLRNTLEYDEEHLLRRNAIRRILKRRLGEESAEAFSIDLLRELIWARYLPNGKVPEMMVATVAGILAKYRVLFDAAEGSGDGSEEWLLDVVSAEVEYALSPPYGDEALANLAYEELRSRIQWASTVVAEQDRDLQLYVAVHRAALKSNLATLRFRTLCLFFPDWTKAGSGSPVVGELSAALPDVIQTIERHMQHPAADQMFRLVRKYIFVFQLLHDVAKDRPEDISAALNGDASGLDASLRKAASSRYRKFHARLRRGVVRAVLFLLCTKSILALLIELPYERFVLGESAWTPLLVNIAFHPFLLGFIGLTVTIPEKKNTARVIDLAHALLGQGNDFSVTFKAKRTWGRGSLAFVFRLLYAAFFLFTIGIITTLLTALRFNPLSIVFFLFFLALVTFFGLKIRSSRKELLVIDAGGGTLGTVSDILFLPIIRAGRWIAMRAPRVNIFLFFLDYIIEAPFKSAIRLIEGWLSYLREKREEI